MQRNTFKRQDNYTGTHAQAVWNALGNFGIFILFLLACWGIMYAATIYVKAYPPTEKRVNK